MKNKEQLLTQIEQLPKFVLRDIYIKSEEITNDGIVESENKYTKENRLIGITEKHQSPIITTISKNYQLVQFDAVFNPIVNYFSNVDGELKYYWGSSILFLFPDGQEFKTDDNHNIGLIVTNSVNKMMAININFCVLYNDYKVMLPKDISRFRQLHLGKVKEIVEDYESFISLIKESWKTITNKFNRDLTDTDVESIVEQMKLGKKYNKKIEKLYEITQGLKLWDLFIDMVKMISDRKYKREENKLKKLKLLSEVVYTQSLVEAI